MIPQIQIYQQSAKIAFDADLGTWDMKQPRATVEQRTTPPRLEIHSPSGELSIDQSKARDALGIGGHLEATHRIYSQMRQIAMEGIARRVQEGSRLAAIHIDANPFAEIARTNAFRRSELQYTGPASYDNVELEYRAHPPEIQFIEGRVDRDVQVNHPILHYTRGKLDIYMQQYAKVTIIPPELDWWG